MGVRPLSPDLFVQAKMLFYALQMCLYQMHTVFLSKSLAKSVFKLYVLSFVELDY
jgi:hypothetical protein